MGSRSPPHRGRGRTRGNTGRPPARVCAADGALFQSLSGFFRPCNYMVRSVPVGRLLRFNPCRVFSGLATRPVVIRFYSGGYLFQSLSGFFRPCNRKGPLSNPVTFCVSIPVGFFQALQPSGVGVSSEAVCVVSIPVGFFQALQHWNQAIYGIRQDMFQSLSGFFRPCN